MDDQRTDEPMPQPQPDEPTAVRDVDTGAAAESVPLDGSDDLDRGDDWAGRWDEIQIRFVDEPRRSIEEADALVDEVITELTARLDGERQRLEHQWAAGAEPSTEDLRVALQHYRAFLDRLLAT